jgi:hypothetical protein
MLAETSRAGFGHRLVPMGPKATGRDSNARLGLLPRRSITRARRRARAAISCARCRGQPRVLPPSAASIASSRDACETSLRSTGSGVSVHHPQRPRGVVVTADGYIAPDTGDRLIVRVARSR